MYKNYIYYNASNKFSFWKSLRSYPSPLHIWDGSSKAGNWQEDQSFYLFIFIIIIIIIYLFFFFAFLHIVLLTF